MYDLKDKDLVLTNNYIKKKILKELSKNKKIINCTFMNINEFKQTLLETPDELSLYKVMKKYNLPCTIAKEYLKNIHIKYEGIIPIYEYLKSQNLITKKEKLQYERIIVIGYDLEPYIYDMIKDKVHYEIKEEKTYNHKVYEFKTQREEIVYCAEKIREDLKCTKPENIKIVLGSDDYLIELERIFTMHSIILNPKPDNIYSSISVKEFLNTLKETKDIEISLNKISKNEIYDIIVNTINDMPYLKVDDIYIEILKDKLKNKTLKENKLKNSIEIIKYEEVYDKKSHYYILGLNQNFIPKIHSDDEIIPDKIKQALKMHTSNDKNRLEKKKVKEILTNYPNVYASYKLEDSFTSYYPSSIIKDLNLETVKNQTPSLNYSNPYNKLFLSMLLDDYINYGTKNEKINFLYSTYPNIDYKTYDNQFTKINCQTKHYNLSYSSINNYFLCPFKFYIENILKLNKDSDILPRVIGNVSHHVLENMYSVDFELDKRFDEYILKEDLTKRQKHTVNSIKNILKQNIEVIKSQDKNTEFQEKILEKRLSIDKTDDISFTGIIDKINKCENYITITDYKTGNIKFTLDGIDEGLNLQLPVYIYLIKQTFKDLKIAGFYLQRLITSPTLDKEVNLKDNLKLNGYTINREDIIEKIDHTYENSEMIKSMKKTSKGFYKYAKLIDEDEIDKIEKIVDKNIDIVIEAIKEGAFPVNPKKIDKQISCQYCKYQDLCYKKEDDIQYLNLKPFKKIVGEEDAKLD